MWYVTAMLHLPPGMAEVQDKGTQCLGPSFGFQYAAHRLECASVAFAAGSLVDLHLSWECRSTLMHCHDVPGPCAQQAILCRRAGHQTCHTFWTQSTS